MEGGSGQIRTLSVCILNEEGPFHCKDLSLYNQPRGVTLNTDIMRLPIKVPSS